MNLKIRGRSLFRVSAYFGALLLVTQSIDAQSAWINIKDKTNVCQISVPPTWSKLGSPGMANSPDGTTMQIMASGHHFGPFGSETLSLLNIGKVYENSAARILYVTKPNGGTPQLITYHVEVPGRQGSCVAQIPLKPQYSEEEARKIALSLAPTT